jgi:hypothetical protein
VRRLLLVAVLVAAVPAGCAVRPGLRATSAVPPPPIARFLPARYRTLETYRADLGSAAVPDVVVTSTNRSSRSQTGADLQVLSWSPSAARWKLTFDGRSATWPNTTSGPDDSNFGPGHPYGLTYPGKPQPILGTLPQFHVSVDRVAFAPLLGGHRNQLVFSGTYGAAGGMQGILVVVDFRSGAGKVVYTWEGDTGLGSWRISHNVIHAWANYMAPGDSECCPVRTYRFALGARGGRIREVSDDRPLLGVVLRDGPGAHPSVVLTAPHGPSAGRLRPGDVILGVENPPSGSGSYHITDIVSSFRAGQTARLLIRRGTRRLAVSVKLGSLMDPAAVAIRTPATDGSETAL